MNSWNDAIHLVCSSLCLRSALPPQWRSYTRVCSLRHHLVSPRSYSLTLSTLNERIQTAPYFRECLSANDLDDLNIEIIRNTVYKAYLEDFDRFCASLGEPTADVMHRTLAFEADRRTINVTINSFNTELSKEQRAKLFPSIGRLWPEGNNQLARADDMDNVRQACENVVEYRTFFNDIAAASQGNGMDELAAATQLEDRFFRMEVFLNKQAFMQQFQYGVFFSYIKLKEQEIRNLTWIAECIAQDARDRIQDFIPIF